MAQAIGESSRNDSRQTVGAVPQRYAHWLLGAPIPLARDHREEGKTASLEQTEEEARRQETVVVVAGRHTCLCDIPPEQ